MVVFVYAPSIFISNHLWHEVLCISFMQTNMPLEILLLHCMCCIQLRLFCFNDSKNSLCLFSIFLFFISFCSCNWFFFFSSGLSFGFIRFLKFHYLSDVCLFYCLCSIELQSQTIRLCRTHKRKVASNIGNTDERTARRMIWMKMKMKRKSPRI